MVCEYLRVLKESFGGVKGVIWECNNRIKTVSEKPPQRAAFSILLMHILSSADNK